MIDQPDFTTVCDRLEGTQRSAALRSAGSLLCLALSLGGCSTFLAVNEQQERAGQLAFVRGTVAADYEASSGPFVVGLVTRDDAGVHLVDYFVASEAGPWVFAVSAGTYWLAAFEDRNRNGTYDDEPAVSVDWDSPIDLEEGERATGLQLRIPGDGRFTTSSFRLENLMVRSSDDQLRVSVFALSVAGKVTTMGDPRFAREVASEGMWRFYDFAMERQPGIYFLEEYDPQKIPVLFIHGINGTPTDFRTIIENLDRNRFQPWLFFYPSGAKLDGIVELLNQLFTRLKEAHEVSGVAVIAHSMGGLVSRDFVLAETGRSGGGTVRLFVTISSPLGGIPAAGGVENSPVIVHSWHALVPGNDYLDGLFYLDPPAKTKSRSLPDPVAYHLLFSYGEGDGDGVVPIASQLRPEAQEEADSLRGFEESHAGILSNPAAVAHLNELLDSM